MYVCLCVHKTDGRNWNCTMKLEDAILLAVDGGSNFVYEFAGSWLWWSELDWKHLVQVEIR